MGKDNSAPAPLELIRRFVNSVDLEQPAADHLGDLDSARAWLRSAALSSSIVEGDLPRIRGLRDELRAVLDAHGAGIFAGKPYEALSAALDGASVRLSFCGDEEPMLFPPALEGFEALRGIIAGVVYDAQARGTWRRLKACRKPSCRFAYYDRSKNGSGSWCSMDTCGNRVKAERRRARERGAPSD